MSKPYLFIDRDGTMGGASSFRHPQDFTLFHGTREAFAMLKKAGFTLVIVTNQACIARGLDGGYNFAAEFRDIGADDWFICPHDTQDHCRCRKPKTGLLEDARNKYRLDLSQCYMIGDRWSDMAAGGKMGMKLILVLTGHGHEALGRNREKWLEFEPALVAETLRDAADWLIRKCG